MIERGYSEKEASAKTALKAGGQVAWAGIGGALSGGAMGGVASTSNYVQNKSTGATIRSNERITDMLDIASLSPQESDALAAYTEYAKRGVNAENITDAQLGNLYGMVEGDAASTVFSKKSTTEQKADAETTYNRLSKMKTENKAAKVATELSQSNEEGVVTPSTREMVINEQAKGMSEAEANLFRLVDDGHSNAVDYADSFNLVVAMAQNEYDQDYILEHRGVLSTAQVNSIYQSVVTNPKMAQQKRLDALIQEQGDNLEIKGTVDDSVIDYENTGAEGKINWKDLHPNVKATIAYVSGFATKVAGMDVQLVTNGRDYGFTGQYDRQGNTMLVDITALTERVKSADAKGRKDNSKFIVSTVAHEVTHWMEEKAPELYAQYDKMVMDALTSNGRTEAEVLGRRRALLEKAEAKRAEKENRKPREITDKEVRREVIARASEDMLALSEEGKKFFETLTENEQKQFVDKIKEVIQNIKDWIKNVLSTLKSDAPEAQELRALAKDLDAISKKWDDMLRQAAKANAAMKQAGVNDMALYDGAYDIQLADIDENAFKEYSKTINKVVDKAIKNKGDIDEPYNQKKISEVDSVTAAMVYKASGGKIDISQKHIALNGYDVWHEYQRHTNIADELARQQIAFTQRQFTNAIKSVYKPDMIESLFSTTNNPTQRVSFAYAKKTKRGNYVVVEAVGGNRNPNIVPVEIIQVTKEKWQKWIGSGKTLGEMLFENDPEKLSALDVVANKKNRVTAAQFASNEAIANTLRSPRFDNIVPQQEENVNTNNQNSDIDTEYMDAVENGNVSTAQKLVDNAAKSWGAYSENGKPVKLSHGTKGKDFTVFRKGDIGFHFGTKEQAKNKAGHITPAKTANLFFLDEDGEIKTGRIIDAYLKMDNPLTFARDLGEWTVPRMVGYFEALLNNESSIEIEKYDRTTKNTEWEKVDPKEISDIRITEKDRAELEGIKKQYERDALSHVGEDEKDYTYSSRSSELLRSFLINKGYDSIKYLNEYEGKENDYSYAVFFSNQIKSADPITYDDNGNIIPLSKRFDSNNEDIRYSDIDELDDLNAQLKEKQNQIYSATMELRKFDAESKQEKLFDLLNKEGVPQDEIDKALQEYSNWGEESGYAAAFEKQSALKDEEKLLRREIQKVEDRLHEKLKEQITHWDDEDIKKYVAKAVRKYHTTTRLDKASYLVTTGSMLDFSDGQGYRVKDHREISEILDLPDYAEYSDGMIAFMNMGNIRLQTYGIDVSAMPNAKQFSALRDIIFKIMRENDEFSVDFSKTDGYSAGSVTYGKGTSASKIIADIKSYFETGVVPEEQSSIRDFLYSDIDELDINYDMMAKLKETTVDKYLQDYAAKSSPNYAQAYIAYMSPSDYLDMTTSGYSSRLLIENEATKFDKERFVDAVNYQPIQLRIDHETGEVVGHEGRHRMVALMDEGIRDVPVLLFDSSNKYSKETLEDFVLTGQFNEKHKATIKTAIPLNYANRDTIIKEFSELSRSQKINERYSIRRTLQYSDIDSEVDIYEVLGENKRLQKENKKLREDFDRLMERMKLEKQITHGKRLNENQLELVAGHIRNIGNSNYSKPELVNKLRDVYTYLATSNEVTWDSLFARLYGIAEDVLGETRPTLVPNNYYHNIYRDLRNMEISLSEEQKRYVKTMLGVDAHKAFFGKIKVSDKGMPLNSKWEELAGKYPNEFETENDKDQVLALLEIYEAAKELKEVAEEYDKVERTRWLANEIYNQYWNVSAVKTTADRYDKQIKRLNYEHRNAMKELRDSYNERLEKQKKADRAERSRIFKKLREDHIKELQEIRKSSKERLDKYKDEAKRKTKVQSVTAGILSLNEMLVKNSKDKHIHEAMKGPVINLIQAIDFSSKRALGMWGGDMKGVPTNKDISLQKALSQVKDMMAEASVGKEDLVELYGHDLDADIKAMVESVDNIMRAVGDNEFILNKMTLDDLTTLDKVVKTIKQAVTKMNEFHTVHHAKGIANLAQEEIVYADKLGKAKIYKDKAGVRKLLAWRNINPYYAFKRFGAAGKKIFEAFQDGYDKFAFNIKEIIDFTNSTYNAKEVQDWEKEIKSFKLRMPATENELSNPDYEPQYQEIKMTVAQIMDLYLLNKREAARVHLLGGGIRVADIETKGSEVISQAEGALLEQSEIDQIIKTLTPRQIEVADALSHFMNTTSSDWGNEVSMARFGYKAFGEKNYVPMQVDKNNLAVDDETEKNNSLFRLLNMSFTKALTENASNRLVVSSIFDVFAQHTSDMAKYNALALPVLDAFRWYNYKEKGFKGEMAYDTKSVKQAIENAFGKDGQSYITTFLKDLNGQENTSRDTIGKGFFTKAKIAAVGANIRVALLQPTAYLRASANIAPKYLLKGITLHKPKTAIDLAEKYCGMALWKSLGYFDTNVQRGVSDQIKHAETKTDKLIELSMKGAELGDKITFGYLWNAAELEIREKRQDLKVGSEEYYQEVGKRLRDIIYSTQVVDSVMTRSEMMRSSDWFDKFLTTFASEPTLSYSMLADAYLQTQLDARELGSKKAAIKKNSKRMARVFVAYTATNLAAALVESVFDVLRDNDDDDEEDAWELVKLYFENFATNQSIAAKIPWLKEGVSIAQGFSSSRMDTQWMQTFANLVKQILKLTQGEGSWGKTVKNGVQTASYFSGLPFYNAYRDTLAFFDWLTPEELDEALKDFY